MRSTILCVDDERVLLNILSEQIQSWFGLNHNVKKAISGDEAIKIINECIESGEDVSVVVSDYIMPDMKGDELLEKVSKIDPKIKRIMITGYSSIEGIVRTINNAGLYRFISKPWNNKDLMLTLQEALRSYEHEKITLELARKYEILKAKYEKLSERQKRFWESISDIAASAIDSRVSSDKSHSKRVAQYSGFLGKSLDMSKDKINILVLAANLHDIGKLGMTDDDLTELEKLKTLNEKTDELRKKQIQISEDILKAIKKNYEIIEAIKYQFEKYDGSGLFKLSGKDIPLASRIIAIANEFDFLKKKSGFTLSQVVERFESLKGTLFDPELIDSFIKIIRPDI